MADKERAIAILQDEVKENPDGYELFFDYREKIDGSTIATAFEKYSEMMQNAKESGTVPDCPDTFAAYLEDYVREEWQLEVYAEADQIENDFKYNRTDEEWETVQEYLEEEGITLREALYDEGFAGVRMDIGDILSEYHMNLMFATPNEENMDMGSIPDMFISDVQEEQSVLQNSTPEYQEKHFDNALAYLVHQQGHQISQVAEVLYTGEPTTDNFLQTVVDEINEFPLYSMAELTALVTLDKEGLDVLDQIAKGEGTIELSKDTMIGLYNEWQGTGSQLAIELDKPFVVPADMVRNVQIEGQKSDNVKGYTVDDVYGLIGKAWKGTVEATDKDSGREAIEASMKKDVNATLDIVELKAAEAEKDGKGADYE